MKAKMKSYLYSYWYQYSLFVDVVMMMRKWK